MREALTQTPKNFYLKTFLLQYIWTYSEIGSKANAAQNTMFYWRNLSAFKMCHLNMLLSENLIRVFDERFHNTKENKRK